MTLKLMYITNKPAVALIAQKNGVERIFVDMEYIGKAARQGGMDSVQNHHSFEDIARIREVLTASQLLVRVNPIHGKMADYVDSREEIEKAIENGADVIMLPYFKTPEEVREFVEYVDGRCTTMLLLETPEAAERIDEILAVEGIDEIHIGINDLSLGYGLKFMFQLVADGTVERLCGKIREKGISYGFGGIAALGKGMLPAEYVIKEHYRLGSKCAILSRSFCNTDKITDLNEVARIFETGVREIREYEKLCEQHPETYQQNHEALVNAVNRIVAGE